MRTATAAAAAEGVRAGSRRRVARPARHPRARARLPLPDRVSTPGSRRGGGRGALLRGRHLRPREADRRLGERSASFTEGPNDVYAPGAWLVGYLLDAYGPGPFLSLYAALPHGATLRRWTPPSEARLWQEPRRHLGGGARRGSAAKQLHLAVPRPTHRAGWASRSTPPGPAASPSIAPSSWPQRRRSRSTTSAAGLTLGPCGPTPPGDILFGTPAR